MNDLILHQYASSPFSEKVRLMLGFKKLAYRSVEIPMFNPKPDAEALTGGYRRTPFLQIGCDVYCDTRLIAAVLEARAPQPPLVPRGHEVTANMLAQWSDQILFPTTTPFAFKPEAMARMGGDLSPDQAQGFMEDRMAMVKTARVRPLGRIAFDHMPAYLALLEAQLGERDYLLTDAPTLADLGVYPCIWFLERADAAVFETRPALGAWFKRLAAIGHGEPSVMTSSEAIEVCRAAEPIALGEGIAASDNGAAIGDAVQVSPVDYGHEPTVGELVHIGTDELVLRREDARAGLVHVHFPRVGFQLKPAGV